MAAADPNNTGTDSDLNAHFSTLAMAGTTGPPDGSTAVFPPFPDSHTAAYWAPEDTAYTSLPPDPTYGAPQYFPMDSAHPNTHGNIPPPPADPDYPYGQPSAPTAARPWICNGDGCTKSFRRECDLDKRRRCDLCAAGGAETKDLNRHMWVKHPDAARARGVRREESACPRCAYTGRSDNVKRHRDVKGHW
ncbi:hypothetical protein BT67DRAFT_435784 [Trichocladium antarcticum]|uniref:C2H2-type domain-containing protein n=1 Tax=Trichocladium antarcticum TaxID=1450529 RepID=A0AAN6ZBH6_9PEZI|nr:hypothetical protein BT67DRAFT_435784 [Trichocladium antarcticum]